MREIKFRAWDKIAKKYIYDEDNYPNDIKEERYTKKGYGHPYDMDEWYPMCDMHQLNAINIMQENYKDSIIFEQYTGLKDKNGVEIYEGDKFEYEDIIYRVVWWGDGFALEAEGFEPFVIGHDDWVYGKVIGSIHKLSEGE